MLAECPRLRQNQRLTTRILMEEKKDVLTLQRGQFLDSGGSRIAYVLDEDNVAHRRSIEIGARSLAAVEIVNGLSEGEVVVISSIDQFRSADSVSGNQLTKKPRSKHMLSMQNISMVYRAGLVETHALREFSLEVEEGDFVSVTGPSGSGKTTFLNIAGLLESFTTDATNWMAGMYLSLSDTSALGYETKKSASYSRAST